jgi:hypothetical protein
MASDQRILLTVILHHDQSKTLEEIMAHLRETGFYRDFPPPLFSYHCSLVFTPWSWRKFLISEMVCVR